MRLSSATLLLSFLSFSAQAQTDAANETLSFAGKAWRIETAEEAKVETYSGQDTLLLRRSYIWLEGEHFSDGVIEFDVAYDEVQGFIGPVFRAAREDERWEEFYVRSHLNKKPDALQYTPVEHGTTAWQIFTDGNALASVSENYDEWNHVKVIVKGDKADFYFNSDKPVLHVPDLKTDIKEGGVGLRVSGPVTARFSNIVFRSLREGEGILGKPKEPPELPEGLITSWMVSSVFPEDSIADALSVGRSGAKNLTWSPLSVETNGIANISRLHKRFEEGGSTVFIRQVIKSDKAQMKKLRFGYSDRVRIYLNGKRVYEGVADWRARDYRFLGTVGFFDSVGLDLKKGENELLVAVSETFGGWAWAGAVEDQKGVTLTNSAQ